MLDSSVSLARLKRRLERLERLEREMLTAGKDRVYVEPWPLRANHLVRISHP